jgi:hypothetical protein
MDFLVVPTARFRLFYAWFVIGHGRREIIHFGVTAHPTSAWVIQQLREAFSEATQVQCDVVRRDENGVQIGTGDTEIACESIAPPGHAGDRHREARHISQETASVLCARLVDFQHAVGGKGGGG